MELVILIRPSSTITQVSPGSSAPKHRVLTLVDDIFFHLSMETCKCFRAVTLPSPYFCKKVIFMILKCLFLSVLTPVEAIMLFFFVNVIFSDRSLPEIVSKNFADVLKKIDQFDGFFSSDAYIWNFLLLLLN